MTTQTSHVCEGTSSVFERLAATWYAEVVFGDSKLKTYPLNANAKDGSIAVVMETDYLKLCQLVAAYVNSSKTALGLMEAANRHDLEQVARAYEERLK